ncbi:MAG TPA: hypothetical protein VJL56_05215 [Candidatus Bathyarchaeia archaeon]|nr:hypothetical protein [Candidatus Bathyarchaeia archaeon]
MNEDTVDGGSILRTVLHGKRSMEHSPQDTTCATLAGIPPAFGQTISGPRLATKPESPPRGQSPNGF